MPHGKYSFEEDSRIKIVKDTTIVIEYESISIYFYKLHLLVRILRLNHANQFLLNDCVEILQILDKIFNMYQYELLARDK